MKIPYGDIRKVCIFIMFMAVVTLFMPALMYKASAESAENLITVLIEENETIVQRTTELVKAKLDLTLPEELIERNIRKMLYSENENDVDSTITRVVRNYRIPLSYKEQELFSNYMKKKRLYFLQNSDKIEKYVNDYRKELQRPVSGFYLQLTGFPKKISIIQE